MGDRLLIVSAIAGSYNSQHALGRLQVYLSSIPLMVYVSQILNYKIIFRHYSAKPQLSDGNLIGLQLHYFQHMSRYQNAIYPITHRNMYSNHMQIATQNILLL